MMICWGCWSENHSQRSPWKSWFMLQSVLLYFCSVNIKRYRREMFWGQKGRCERNRENILLTKEKYSSVHTQLISALDRLQLVEWPPASHKVLSAEGWLAGTLGLGLCFKSSNRSSVCLCPTWGSLSWTRLKVELVKPMSVRRKATALYWIFPWSDCVRSFYTRARAIARR